MSNRTDLSVSAFAAPFDNPFLDETKYNEQFSYRYGLIKLYIFKMGSNKGILYDRRFIIIISNIY